MDEQLVIKHLKEFSKLDHPVASEEYNLSKNKKNKQMLGVRNMKDSFDGHMDNAFVSEMAVKTFKDFKGRSRTNMVPRVAKRINQEERRTKDLQSTMTSVTQGNPTKKRHRASKSIGAAKVMSYAEIKKWNQKYRLDGKSVY